MEPCSCHVTPAGIRVRERRAQAGLGRDRRHGAARVRGGRDDVEQLPGHALERRASEDVGPREQGPDRRRSRVGPCERPAAGRRGDVHAMGGLARSGRGQARELLPGTLPAGVHARHSTRGWRRSRSRPRTLRRRPSRCRSTGWRPGRKPSGSIRRPRHSPQQVRRDIQRSSNYVLGVVLFAVALFFAGMSTKLTAGVCARRCSRSVASSSWERSSGSRRSP